MTTRIFRIVVSHKKTGTDFLSPECFATIVNGDTSDGDGLPVPDTETIFSITTFVSHKHKKERVIKRLRMQARSMAWAKGIRRITWTDTNKIWRITEPKWKR